MVESVVVRLGDIAAAVGGSLSGDPEFRIARVLPVEKADHASIAVVMHSKYFDRVDSLGAGAVIVPASSTATRTNVIRVENPRRALLSLLPLFGGEAPLADGVHPGATVSPSATLGERVRVAAGAVIGDRVVLGDDVEIHANAVIGAGASIGEGSVIHPNATIYGGTKIGRRVIVHAGTVIGSAGFGYEATENGLEKIPDLGHVEIEDDVHIGANCAIDRAMIDVTRIGAGTVIDNLVQIGHNSVTGKHCIIAGQAGISGSVTLGDNVILLGQAGVADHVTLGDGVRIGAKSGVHSSIEGGDWVGSPAMKRERYGRVYATYANLPEYREKVRSLERKVAELERALEQLLSLR